MTTQTVTRPASPRRTDRRGYRLHSALLERVDIRYPRPRRRPLGGAAVAAEVAR